MNYLLNSEYESYGLEPETPESWVSAASTVINAHCNRPMLWTFAIHGARTRSFPAAMLCG